MCFGWDSGVYVGLWLRLYFELVSHEFSQGFKFMRFGFLLGVIS